MKRLVFVAALVIAASPLSAQDNPFKLPRARPPSRSATPTPETCRVPPSTAFRRTGSSRTRPRPAKFFGKTTDAGSWTLFTPEWNYSADLTKKTGLKLPNVLPYMEKAYDDLGRHVEQRLHQNMQDMAQMMSKAFAVRLSGAGEDRHDQDVRG